MSKWVEVRDAFEHWVSHLLVAVQPAAGEITKQVVTAAALAALASHANGGDKHAVEHAAKDAAINSLKTVGVTVGLETVAGLGSLIGGHVDPGPPPV